MTSSENLVTSAEFLSGSQFQALVCKAVNSPFFINYLYICGRCGALMVSMLDSRLSGQGLRFGRRYFTLSRIASLHQDV